MSLRIRRDVFWGCISYLVLSISLSVMDKGLFEVSRFTGTDLFYAQIEPFLTGVNVEDLQILQYAHFLRFLVVSPFVFGEIYDLGGAFFAAVLFLFAIPVLSAVKSGKYRSLKYLIIFIPIFVSFRTYLVACGIGYLFIAIYHHKSNALFFASLLISTLSSGVVMVWILISVINVRSFKKQYRYVFFILLFTMLLILLPSLLHKFYFANEVLTGYSDYLLRGTLVESIIKGWWSRVVVYVFCLAAMLSIATRALFTKRYRLFYLSYTPFFIGALFEGLGFISGLIVLIMFFSGFRPNQRSDRMMTVSNLPLNQSV